MGPGAGLDEYGMSGLHRDSIPGQYSPYRVDIPTELSRPPVDVEGTGDRRTCCSPQERKQASRVSLPGPIQGKAAPGREAYNSFPSSTACRHTRVILYGFEVFEWTAFALIPHI